MKSLFHRFFRQPFGAAAMVLMATAVVVVVNSIGYYDDGFWRDVLVEAHGLVLELSVLGVLLVYLDQRRARLVRIQRLQDEIDDLRLWHSEEAAFRIRGNILRLSEEGVRGIDIARCFLKRMRFRNADLSGLRGQQVDLGESYLRGAVLRGADLDTAYVGYSDLRGVDLRESHLVRTRFPVATLRSADFRGADGRAAKFEHADLGDANFAGADLEDAVFRGAVLKKAKLKRARNLTSDQLMGARTLYQADLPSGFREAIEVERPHLFDKFPPEDADRFVVTGPEACS